jgi:hypothetical protein
MNNKTEWKFYPLYALGKTELKIGLEMESGVQLLYSNRIGASKEFGIYLDLAGTMLMEEFSAEALKGFYDLDFGWYHETSLVFRHDGLFNDVNLEMVVQKKKEPWIVLSNVNIVKKLNTLDKYYIKDNKFLLVKPTVTYYNLIDKKETTLDLPLDKLTLYIDGKPVEKVENFYVIDNKYLDQSNKITATWTYEGKVHEHDIYVKLIRSKIKETFVSSLVASEILHVYENVWSYYNGSKYGLVTAEGTVFPARYDRHFHYGPAGVCSYRNNEYTCFENNNYTKEILGDGWGIEPYQWDLVYDSSKKWLYAYTYDMDYNEMLAAPYGLDKLTRSRNAMVARVSVGSGATKEYAYDWTERNEFALINLQVQSSGVKYNLLTGFDFKAFVYIDALDAFEYLGTRNQAYYIVKGKNNLWGILESTGKLTVNMEYDRILGNSKESNDPKATFFTVVKDGTFRVIDANGNSFYEGVTGEKLSQTIGDTFWKLVNNQWFSVDLGMNE